jgi:hypothetical protein
MRNACMIAVSRHDNIGYYVNIFPLFQDIASPLVRLCVAIRQYRSVDGQDFDSYHTRDSIRR